MRRLFDDPQLPAALRRDLQQSRAAAEDYPVSEKLLQLRAALSDSSRQPLGAGHNGHGAPWTDGGGRLAWRISHPGWKLLLIMAVAGTGAVSVPRIQRALTGGETMVSREPGSLPPMDAEQEPLQLVEQAPALPQPTAAEAIEDPSKRPAAAVERPRTSQPAPSAKTPNPVSSSRREIAQLVRIRELLKQDPAAAYELAQRSEREFPAGLLSEERQALAVIALAKTGATDDARRRANAFFLRYPQNPMRGQLEAALAR